MRCNHNFNAERTTSAVIVEIRERAAGGIPHLLSAQRERERKVGAGKRARVGTPSSAEDSLTEDRMALVEMPRRAAPNLMESGRWPRRSTSGLAARGAVLRPLDADEVRGEIALLAAAGVEAIAVCFLHSRRAAD